MRDEFVGGRMWKLRDRTRDMRWEPGQGRRTITEGRTWELLGQQTRKQWGKDAGRGRAKLGTTEHGSSIVTGMGYRVDRCRPRKTIGWAERQHDWTRRRI